MSLKISGLELVRRLEERIPLYEEAAANMKSQAASVASQLDKGPLQGMQIGINPADIMIAHADWLEARAKDLTWLKSVLVHDEVHEVTVEEIMALGIIGKIGPTEVKLSMEDDN